jgi:hypothetical protein
MRNAERRRIEAENRVRKLITQIPSDYIADFFDDFNKNLRDNGSNKTVSDIMREHGMSQFH